jgi:hypothetical protein
MFFTGDVRKLEWSIIIICRISWKSSEIQLYLLRHLLRNLFFSNLYQECLCQGKTNTKVSSFFVLFDIINQVWLLSVRSQYLLLMIYNFSSFVSWCFHDRLFVRIILTRLYHRFSARNDIPQGSKRHFDRFSLHMIHCCIAIF